MGQSSQDWVLRQALWSGYRTPGKLSVAPIFLAEGTSTAWSGADDGCIAKWTYQQEGAGSESKSAPTKLRPALLLCGHQAALTVLSSVDNGATVLSIDESGCACRWSTQSGQCLSQALLGFLPGSAAVHVHSGLLAVVCRGASTGVTGEFPIALVDCVGLEVVALLAPSSLHSLEGFFSVGMPVTDAHRGADLLALSLFAGGGSDLVVGVARQGFLLVWHVDACTSSVVLQPTDKSLRAEITAVVPKLQGALVHASFSRGGRHLLLVSDTAWVLAAAEQRGFTVHYSLAIAAGSLSALPADAPIWQAKQGAIAPSAGQQSGDAKHSQVRRVNVGESGRGAAGEQAGFSGRSPYVGGLLLQSGGGLSALLWDEDGVGELVQVTPSAAGELAAVGQSDIVNLQSAGRDRLKLSGQSVVAAGESRVLIASGDGQQVAIAHLLGDRRGRHHRQWEPWEGGRAILNREEEAEVSIGIGREAGNGDLHSAGQNGKLVEGGRGDAWPEDITVTMAAQPNSLVPHLLFQGLSSGLLSVSKLAAASLPCLPQTRRMLPGSRSSYPSWQSAVHRGSVTCLLEHACEVFDPTQGQALLHVLLSGATDGAVHAADLTTGASVFLLHAHTAPVLTLSAPPRRAAYPWCCQVVSCGADGLLCLLSLELRQCLLRLPGFPCAGSVPRFLWCLPKGYIACWLGRGDPVEQLGPECGVNAACAAQPDRHTSETMLMVWDLHSGRRDRELRGTAADATIRDLAIFAAEHELPGMSAEPLIWSQPGALRGGAQILEMDIRQLLDVQASADANEDAGQERLAALQQERGLPGIAYVALALALLHVWGLDSGVDRQLAAMLEALDLLDAGTTAAMASGLHSATGLLQGVLKGAGLAHTLLLPGNPALADMSEESGGVSVLPMLLLPGQPASAGSGQDAAAQGSAQAGRGGAWRPGMWCNAPRWVAMRQLAIVSMAKHLQELSPATEDGLVPCICNACASLTAFYAVRLRERLPGLVPPDLGTLMLHFQDPLESLRDAARTLLAASSDPITYGVPEPAPFAAFANLIRGTGTMADSHLQQPGTEAWDPEAVMTAAAICILHPASVPDELMARAVPGLVSLALVISQRATQATSMLTEALQGPAGRRWRPFLGDLRALTGRVLAICERLSSAAAARTSEPGLPRSTPAPGASKSAAASLGPLRAAKAQLLATKPPVKGTASTDGARFQAAGPKSQQRSVATQRTGVAAEGKQAPQHGSGVLASTGNGHASAGHDSADRAREGERPAAEAGPVTLKAGEAMQYRDALHSLLPALAALDFIMFLHLLGHRLAGGVPGHSPSHLLLLTTIVRLLHTSQGKALLAAHLPLLMAVVLKGLDPSNTALRRACRQGVMALVKEVSMACPMVAVHASSLQLAVGRAPWGVAGLSAQAGEMGEPIAVYDLHTGRKQRALHFRADGSADVGHHDETVAALAFSSGSGALAAWSPEGGLLRVWLLVAGWSQRFQRTTAVLIPSQVFKLEAAQERMGGPQVLDFRWSVCWESESSISVNYGQNRLGTVNLRQG